MRFYLDSIADPFFTPIDELLLALLLNNNLLSDSYSALDAALRCPTHIRSVCVQLSICSSTIRAFRVLFIIL